MARRFLIQLLPIGILTGLFLALAQVLASVMRGGFGFTPTPSVLVALSALEDSGGWHSVKNQRRSLVVRLHSEMWLWDAISSQHVGSRLRMSNYRRAEPRCNDSAAHAALSLALCNSVVTVLITSEASHLLRNRRQGDQTAVKADHPSQDRRSLRPSRLISTDSQGMQLRQPASVAVGIAGEAGNLRTSQQL